MKLTTESTVINDKKINTDIDTAQTTADDAKTIATDTAQYFWFASSGTDTGAHISEQTRADFEANPSGGNLLANSNGIAVRDGMTELTIFSADGMEVYKGGNSRAQFFDTIRLGASSGQRATISSTALEMYDENNKRRIRINSGEGVIVGRPDKGRAVITDQGMTIYDTNNNDVASYGSDVRIGQTSSNNIFINSGTIYFRYGTAQFASISGNDGTGILHISNTTNSEAYIRAASSGLTIHDQYGCSFLASSSGCSWSKTGINPQGFTYDQNGGGVYTVGDFRVEYGNLKVQAYGNTLSLGSLNGSYCHIYNSLDIPFYFNNTIITTKSVSANETIGCGTYFNSIYTYNNPGGASATSVQDNTIYIASNGNFIRGSSRSSRKVKHDINLISDELLNPHRLYDIPVVQFVYNESYLGNKKDCRYLKLLPGFIAEDVNEIYPRAADISEEGEIVGWNDHYMIPPMLALIQEQHKELEQLKTEVNKLKGAM